MDVDKKGLNEKVRFRGKDVKFKKIEKHVSHKPRLFGAVLTNIFIILAIVMTIILLIG